METHCVALLWRQSSDDYYVLLVRDGGSIYSLNSMIYGRDGYIRSAWDLNGLETLFVLRDLTLECARGLMQEWILNVEWTFNDLFIRGYRISFEENCNIYVSDTIRDSYDLVAEVYDFLCKPAVE